jgi:tetratricopeptide (TPR) repeat protein
MKKGFCIAVSLMIVFWSTSAYSVDAGSESVFSLGLGARALGFGGGFVSLSDDASAIFYNPAGLPHLEYQEFSATHVTLFEGSLYDAAAWGSPIIGIGGFGAGFMRLGTRDIIKRTNYVNTGSFSYSTWQFLLGYGRTFGSNISVGASLKILNQSLDNFSDYGIGMDFGMKARLYKNLNLGITARNLIPPELSLDSSADKIPLAIAGGLGISHLLISKKIEITASVEGEKFKDRDMKLHTGLELTFNKSFSLRGGYDRDNFSFGTGLVLGRLKVDYAYKIMDYIEDSHRFTLSLLIGASVTDQRERRRQEEQQRGTILLADERQRQFTLYKTKADTFYNQLRLDSALVYYQRALVFDESNVNIKGTIAAIENIQRIKADEERKIQTAQSELEQSVRTYNEQANIFYSRKYYRASLDLLSLVFDIDPKNAEAHTLKKMIDSAVASEIMISRDSARIAENQGRVIEAIEAYNRILDLSPDDSAAKMGKLRVSSGLDIAQQLRLGIDLFNQNKLNEARRQFENVLRIDPQQPVAIEYLGKLKASPVLPSTLEDIQKDKDIWPFYLEGLRRMRNKEYQMAIDSWQKVLEKYPNNSNTLDNIKQARLRLESQ